MCKYNFRENPIFVYPKIADEKHMETTNWTSENITDQKGQNVIITGASSGLGLEAARVLSQKGANVIMAVRSIEKGKAAIAKIKSETPAALFELMQLDLADLNSVHDFSNKF
ncbi:MAG TPA: SDR family NAD(P)-dependent oxidoreductase, partial [Cytophagaceae bacterium]|nr:SDR family NAD(P)-dependent oxidoreductase [Cytophagaceae bacterium]